MPLSKDRELIQVSAKAYKHLQRIKAARKKLGLPYSITGFASELILSQPVPTINAAHWVQKPVIVAGEMSGVAAGGSAGESEG